MIGRGDGEGGGGNGSGGGRGSPPMRQQEPRRRRRDPGRRHSRRPPFPAVSSTAAAAQTDRVSAGRAVRSFRALPAPAAPPAFAHHGRPRPAVVHPFCNHLPPPAPPPSTARLRPHSCLPLVAHSAN